MNGIAFARTAAIYTPNGFDTILATPYITSDGGKTWEPLPLYTANAVQYLPGGKITNLYIPKDINQPSILQISEDFGASFQDVTLPVGSKPEYRPYMYNFITKDIGYCSAFFGTIPNEPYTVNTALYKTTDGGYTWNIRSKLTTCELGLNILFISEDTGYSFYTNCNIVKRTTDGGLTWKGSEVSQINTLNYPSTPHFCTKGPQLHLVVFN